MNPIRLVTNTMMKTAAALLLTLSALTAGAQPRVFPDKALLGVIEIGNFPEGQLDGKAIRFAPGARIMNRQNLSLLPMAIKGKLRVLYQLDPLGQIQIAWELSDDEAAAAKARAEAAKAAQSAQ